MKREEKPVDYEKILDEQIVNLESTVKDQNRQTAKEKGTLSHRAYQFAQDKGLVKTGAKAGAIAIGVGIVLGPYGALAALGLYGAKKVFYDPKKKK